MVEFALACLSHLIAATIWTVAVVALLNTRKDKDRKGFEKEYMNARLDNDKAFLRQQKELLTEQRRIADGLRMVGVAMQVSEMRKAKSDVQGG